MTKFDPNATPESEAFFDELYKSTEHYFYKVYEANKDCDDLFHVVEHGLSEATMFSKSLERRARVAEEKLMIAEEFIERTSRYASTVVLDGFWELQCEITKTLMKKVDEVDP